jgi:DNA-binding transcriptional regulator YiaG
MKKNQILDAEPLVTDILHDVEKISDPQRRLYDLELNAAREFRVILDEVHEAEPVDISLFIRKTMTFGFSQRILALRFGVTTGTFSRWISGENPPREFVRGAIIQELITIVDYIILRLEADADRPNFRTKRPTSRRQLKVVPRMG